MRFDPVRFRGMLILVLGFGGVSFLLSSNEMKAEETSHVVRPGSEEVSGAFIKPCKNKWKMVQSGADGVEREVGTWTDEMEIIEDDGKKRLRRTQVIYAPGGAEMNRMINLVDLETLAPLLFETKSARGRQKMEFSGETVSVTRGSAKPNTEELSEPVFDWSLYGMLLVGFPLKEGYSAKLPYYAGVNPGQKGVSWMSFQVEAPEKVEAGPGKTVQAHKVKTDQGWTFWLTKEAPYVIRLSVPMGGQGKRTWIMM